MFEHYKNYQYANMTMKDDSNGETGNLIEADIPRTFPDLNNMFEQIASLSLSLRELLVAFNNMRPDIGYV